MSEISHKPSMSDLYVDAYPESWYAVAPSSSLKVKEVQPLEAFSQKWVMYRTQSGAVRVMSRFCPHMGASFQKGHLKGEHLVCPFHYWEFNKDGVCAHIPYLREIPSRAKLVSLPVCEHLGWIWVYHGETPSYSLPELSEAHDPDYGERHISQWFDIHPLLILENGCDAQHFKYVHKVNFSRYDVEMKQEGSNDFSFVVNQALQLPFGREVTLRTHIHYVGASTIYGALDTDGKQTARFIAAPLPVSFKRTLFHLIVYTKRLPFWLKALDPLYQWWFARRIFTGSTDDYEPIWRHMSTAHRGVLVSEDRLQQRFRRYYHAHLQGSNSPEEPNELS
jgi:aminopyrrolnitrin oxygenase